MGLQHFTQNAGKIKTCSIFQRQRCRYVDTDAQCEWAFRKIRSIGKETTILPENEGPPTSGQESEFSFLEGLVQGGRDASPFLVPDALRHQPLLPVALVVLQPQRVRHLRTGETHTCTPLFVTQNVLQYPDLLSAKTRGSFGKLFCHYLSQISSAKGTGGFFPAYMNSEDFLLRHHLALFRTMEEFAERGCRISAPTAEQLILPLVPPVGKFLD